jgi:hypothetical protein
MTLADMIEARLRDIPGIRRVLSATALRRIALEAADAAREYADGKHKPSVWCGLHGVYDCRKCEP